MSYGLRQDEEHRANGRLWTLLVWGWAVFHGSITVSEGARPISGLLCINAPVWTVPTNARHAKSAKGLHP
jgi:hypothetical protein